MKEQVIRIGDVEVIDTPKATDKRPRAGTAPGIRRPWLAKMARLLSRTLIVVARLLIVMAFALGRVLAAALQAALRGLDRASGRESDSRNERDCNGA